MNRLRALISNVIAIVLLCSLSLPALAQARRNIALARVGYNTRKAVVRPQGELKEKIDAIDKELAEMARLGRTGEVRHLLAKGLTLLSGKEWDSTLEFTNSLVLRTEAVLVDSSKPCSIRVEQIYQPRVELDGSLAAHASIHKAERRVQGVGAGEKVKDLATLEGVGRDFLDEPLRIESDLSGIADGMYVMKVELRQKDKPLGESTLTVGLYRGLDQRLSAVESGLKKVRGFEDLRAEVLYPLDYIRSVNRGRIEVGAFDPEKALARSEEILRSLRSRRNPFAGRTGDLERHYFLEGAGEIMPYRVYVPTRYAGKEPFPLIIALHGLGATQDSFFDFYGKEFPKLAEQHGYIVAAPLGYRVDGGYGFSLFRSSDDLGQARKAEYSEKDVLQVLELMKKNYKIDQKRIYLAGHSMGAIGTWYLAARYPDIWAAVAPFSGYGNPAAVEKMKGIPAIVIHGDADPTVNVAGSRAMVAELKKRGVEHQYIEVPGGDHISVVQPNFGAVYDFFDKHRRSGP
jgi:predicted esterase